MTACLHCRFYVGCNMCAEWYHGSCVGVSADDIHNLNSFVCQSCRGKNSKMETEELHCICQTPYDSSKYDLCLCVTDCKHLIEFNCLNVCSYSTDLVSRNSIQPIISFFIYLKFTFAVQQGKSGKIRWLKLSCVHCC